MTEVSGNPIVNRTDNCAASYLKTQDFWFNPTSGNSVAIQNISQLNWTGTINQSGGTITAARSGTFAPLGYMTINVSGGTVLLPFFAP